MVTAPPMLPEWRYPMSPQDSSQLNSRSIGHDCPAASAAVLYKLERECVISLLPKMIRVRCLHHHKAPRRHLLHQTLDRCLRVRHLDDLTLAGDIQLLFAYIHSLKLTLHAIMTSLVLGVELHQRLLATIGGHHTVRARFLLTLPVEVGVIFGRL